MRNRVSRAAFAVAGGLVLAAAIPSAASATSFSIDTTVPGGSAWIDGSVGSINGTVNVVNQSISEGAAIGRILLYGQSSEMPTGTLTGIPVFCIDVKDWLGNGVFVEKPLSAITSPAGIAQVSYSSTQLASALKFMVYAQTQGITNQVTSAATQLGIWEILNETSNNAWDVSSGNFNVSLWGGPDAVGLANSWLGASTTTSTTGYTIGVLDPGQGNQLQAFVKAVPPGDNVTPGVPEPTTWAMIVMGFGALGAALRRGKREDSLFA